MSSWSETVYVRFPDEPTARAAAEQLGANFNEDGSPSSGNEHYTLEPFVQWTRQPGTNGEHDAGEMAPGYWAMMRFNLTTEVGQRAYNGVQATGAVVDPATFTPSAVYA